MGRKGIKGSESVEGSKLDKKWGHEAIKVGWVAIPSVLLERQNSLGLDALDLALIMHLVKHWWEPERYPYPGKRQICEALDINESTMRKRIKELEQKKLISRSPKYFPGTKGIKANEYDLSGLVAAVKRVAKDELKDKKEREHKSSLNRRKPNHEK